MKSRRSNSEKGGTLVTTALFATGLVVAVGLVADTGALVYQRTRMQVASDAAALAGAKGLVNGQTYATAQAKAIAAKNGFDLPNEGIKIQNGSRMSVTLSSPVNSIVGRVFEALKPNGMPGAVKPLNTGAKAIADLHAEQVNYGLRPLGVPQQDFLAGSEYVLKQGAGNSLRGNFQALGLDGTGATLYQSAILNGAQRTVKVGDMVPTEPGNMAGPTVTAVNQLIETDRTSYRDAAKGARTPRVVTLPLLDQSFFAATGRSNVTISGFARFYLTYTTSRGEVYGRFIDLVGEHEVRGTSQQYAVRLADDQDPLPPLVLAGTLH